MSDPLEQASPTPRLDAFTAAVGRLVVAARHENAALAQTALADVSTALDALDALPAAGLRAVPFRLVLARLRSLQQRLAQATTWEEYRRLAQQLAQRLARGFVD
jgi:DNA primase